MEILRLDSDRRLISGNEKLLNDKVSKGADIRIKTEFKHNEHVDINSNDNQIVEETSFFPQTVLINKRWSAYFMTLRQPVSIPEGFGDANALSLFLYNQDGTQAVARLNMDNRADDTLMSDTEEHGIEKMHTIKVNDAGTQGVSKVFIYDFDSYVFFADDCYEDLGNDIKKIADAYREGRAVKVGIKGAGDLIWGQSGYEEEIFIHCSSSYYYTQSKLMIANTQPFVSIPCCIPLTYTSTSFRYCWAVIRSDNKVQIRSYDPFKCKWETRNAELDIRWFAKNI